jgi:hypothetical protein
MWRRLSVLGLALTLGAVVVGTARDRAATQQARAAWRDQGVRTQAPPAVSGGTRAFQERN